MAEPDNIDRVRARIHRQRERLARRDDTEALDAEAVSSAARPLATRPRATSPALASLVRIIRNHPVLAVGIGATVLIAGPGRTLRIARKGVRGAIVVMAAYRSLSTVIGLLSSARSASGPSTTASIDEAVATQRPSSADSPQARQDAAHRATQRPG